MKTIEEIKADILTTNPSRKYIINDEEIEQTDLEFQEAVQKRAEMEYEQQLKAKEIADAKATTLAKLAALGLEPDDLKALGL